jgi:tetratricopeptide (TPR) repeat protein
MRVFRLLKSPLALTAVLGLSASLAGAQGTSVQKLFERGAFEEAVQRGEAERNNVESVFFAAQAAGRMNDNGRAAQEYGRLQQAGDDAWKAIGESGVKLAEGNLGAAMAAAERAVAASGDNPYAHYQAGLVANRQNNYERARDGFTRAAELKPDFAYAHYYAGTTNQRLKNIAQMSEHFERFIKLAPDAPERTAVTALLRTLRPR